MKGLFTLQKKLGPDRLKSGLDQFFSTIYKANNLVLLILALCLHFRFSESGPDFSYESKCWLPSFMSRCICNIKSNNNRAMPLKLHSRAKCYEKENLVSPFLKKYLQVPATSSIFHVLWRHFWLGDKHVHCHHLHHQS